MSLITITIGNVIIMRGTLVDEAGAALTGAAVTVSAISPDGVEEALGTATEIGATGVYAITWEPDAEGRWEVRFESAAPEEAAAEGIVYVKESRFQ